MVNFTYKINITFLSYHQKALRTAAWKFNLGNRRLTKQSQVHSLFYLSHQSSSADGTMCWCHRDTIDLLTCRKKSVNGSELDLLKIRWCSSIKTVFNQSILGGCGTDMWVYCTGTVTPDLLKSHIFSLMVTKTFCRKKAHFLFLCFFTGFIHESWSNEPKWGFTGTQTEQTNELRPNTFSFYSCTNQRQEKTSQTQHARQQWKVRSFNVTLLKWKWKFVRTTAEPQVRQAKNLQFIRSDRHNRISAKHRWAQLIIITVLTTNLRSIFFFSLLRQKVTTFFMLLIKNVFC